MPRTRKSLSRWNNTRTSSGLSVGISREYVRNLRAQDLEVAVRDGYVVRRSGFTYQAGSAEEIGE